MLRMGLSDAKDGPFGCLAKPMEPPLAARSFPSLLPIGDSRCFPRDEEHGTKLSAACIRKDHQVRIGVSGEVIDVEARDEIAIAKGTMRGLGSGLGTTAGCGYVLLTCVSRTITIANTPMTHRYNN